MEWGKIYVNDTNNKGLISNIYKQLIQLKSQKTKQLKQNISKGSKSTSFQIRHTDVQQIHEKMLNVTNHQGYAN